MTRSKLPLAALFITLLGGTTLSSSTASATDRSTKAKVSTFVIANGAPSPAAPASRPYLVSFTLEGSPALCATASGSGNTWATLTANYLNPDALKNLLHILTTAKLSGREVMVRALNSNIAGEWGCRIDGLELL
jgi:hypothetical protein